MRRRLQQNHVRCQADLLLSCFVSLLTRLRIILSTTRLAVSLCSAAGIRDSAEVPAPVGAADPEVPFVMMAYPAGQISNLLAVEVMWHCGYPDKCLDRSRTQLYSQNVDTKTKI